MAASRIPFFTIVFFWYVVFAISGADARNNLNPQSPLRLAIAGLVHGHAGGFIRSLEGRTDIVIVGIAESDGALAANYANRFGLDSSLFFTDLESMLDQTNPEAVATFSNTFDHLQVVQACAPRGIHVMVEKPLAVNMDHARTIADAAREHDIHVLVNYETTWYPSNQVLWKLIKEQNSIGHITKIVVRDGHRGPKEIGVGPEFLEWLTDPVLNGGGALTDFGCYGANLTTWLMGNAKPLSVTAVTQHLKDDPVYARVDDEATILLTYPEAQSIIQASWNWPFNRKDMDVYGTDGYVRTIDAIQLRTRTNEPEEKSLEAETADATYTDPVTYLVDVVRGRIEPDGLSSLQNNLIVTEILDAARLSAERGESIVLE